MKRKPLPPPPIVDRSGEVAFLNRHMPITLRDKLRLIAELSGDYALWRVHNDALARGLAELERELRRPKLADK